MKAVGAKVMETKWEGKMNTVNVKEEEETRDRKTCKCEGRQGKSSFPLHLHSYLEYERWSSLITSSVGRNANPPVSYYPTSILTQTKWITPSKPPTKAYPRRFTHFSAHEKKKNSSETSMTMRSWSNSRSRMGRRGTRLRRDGFMLGKDGVGWLVVEVRIRMIRLKAVNAVRNPSLPSPTTMSLSPT